MIEYCRFILRGLYKFASLIDSTLPSCSSSKLASVLRVAVKSVAKSIFLNVSHDVSDVHPSVSANSPFVDDVLL